MRDIYTTTLATICKAVHRRSLNATSFQKTVLTHTDIHMCVDLVLAYCWDTEDLAQLESEGTWYRNMH